jgi:hypothetical protein
MCSLNTFSRSLKKSPRLCATSKAGSRRRRPLLLLLLTLSLSLPASQAGAQAVERSELPPLPGAAPRDPGGSAGAPPAGFPSPLTSEAPAPGGLPPEAGLGEGRPLPHDVWRGVEPEELQRLLAAVPLPSPSPTLAALIAKVLAADPPSDPREREIRAAALRKAGRIEELTALLGVPAEPPASPGKFDAAKASPPQLFLLARDGGIAPETRLAAAERAAALNIIAGEDLARAYRESAQALPKTAQSPAALRAKLFAAFENAPSGKIRAESIEALLASARDEGIEAPIAQALAPASAGLVEDPQATAFAEAGVRVAALAGDERSAWAWIDAGGARLQSWRLLLAAADPFGPRAEAALAQGVELALQGGLPPALLHRLVAVLDALDREVPIPLWEEAAKTPQPMDGDLPPTGMLTSLKQAADAGDAGRTVLLAAAVLGPRGAKGAHLIALGDAVRALKRVGFEAEARRLGFEALYAHWPSRGRA